MADGVPFGNYRLVRRIARGGMAEVFLAKHIGMEGFERRVAIKRILPHLSESDEFKSMFLDEARLAAQLAHPNIVHIYDFGRVEEYYFIGMEFVDGVDLGRLIRTAQKRPLPFEFAARIFSDVCAGLHYAHNAKSGAGEPLGLVHRDITPQNVLVTYDGVVKLVDFGIAKAAWQAGRTRPGVVKGKFAYMSPEQVEGRRLDGRSDVFSAGICMYELLTGVPLVRRDDVHAAMREIRDGKPIEPERYRPDVPPALVSIMRRALATSRDSRYASAHAMQLDLERFLKGTAGPTAHQLGEHLKREHPPLPDDTSGSAAAISDGRRGGASPGTERQDQGTERQQPATRAGDAEADELAITTPGKGLRDALDGTDDDDIATRPVLPAAPRPAVERRRAHENGGGTAVVPAQPSNRRVIVAASVAAVTVLAGALLVFRPWSQPSPEPIIVVPEPPPAPEPAPVPLPVPSSASTPVPAPPPPPAPRPKLDIISRPPAARVTVDGHAVSRTTPVRGTTLDAGLHRVLVERRGYQPRELLVQLGEGEHRTLDVELRPLVRGRSAPSRPTGTLTARTVPWSKVFDGSRLLGTTPMANVPLSEGPHTLTFVNPELPPLKKTVTVRAGEEIRLSLELSK
jgi:serine/threonine-protein kinase